MLIAHLPAGYVVTKTLQKRLETQKFFWLGLLGSILPDFDMLYFHFVDNKQTLHHYYWTHIPAFWFCMLAIFCLFGVIVRKVSYWLGIAFFFSTVFLHLILDSIVDHGIKWAYPFSDKSFYFFNIPAKFDWWVWSFIFHPTFLLELAWISIAGIMLYRSYKN